MCGEGLQRWRYGKRAPVLPSLWGPPGGGQPAAHGGGGGRVGRAAGEGSRGGRGRVSCGTGVRWWGARGGGSAGTGVGTEGGHGSLASSVRGVGGADDGGGGSVDCGGNGGGGGSGGGVAVAAIEAAEGVRQAARRWPPARAVAAAEGRPGALPGIRWVGADGSSLTSLNLFRGCFRRLARMNAESWAAAKVLPCCWPSAPAGAASLQGAEATTLGAFPQHPSSPLPVPPSPPSSQVLCCTSTRRSVLPSQPSGISSSSTMLIHNPLLKLRSPLPPPRPSVLPSRPRHPYKPLGWSRRQRS